MFLNVIDSIGQKYNHKYKYFKQTCTCMHNNEMQKMFGNNIYSAGQVK